MATVSFHLRLPKKNGLFEGNLFLRIIHERKVKEVTTNYRLYASEWNHELQCVVLPTDYSMRVRYLAETEDNVQDDLKRLAANLDLLESLGNYSIEDILMNFEFRSNVGLLGNYVRKLHRELMSKEQFRLAKAYQSALNKFLSFNNYRDIDMNEINDIVIRRFESYLRDTGKNMNTVSFYLRNLRSIYNRAIQEHLIMPRYENPFQNVCTRVFATRKRALTKTEICQLSELDLLFDRNLVKNTLCNRQIRRRASENMLDNPNMQYALALFMFCFHARGMSFVDMAFLKKKNLQGDNIVYCRRKTGKDLHVRITRHMRDIINYFRPMTADSPYVFPIIDPNRDNEYVQYETALTEQNKQLKKLGQMAGLSKLVSTHVARHSWATIARMEHIPVSVISEALGHRDERTTSIYLDSFNTSVIDRVSEQISRLLD